MHMLTFQISQDMVQTDRLTDRLTDGRSA